MTTALVLGPSVWARGRARTARTEHLSPLAIREVLAEQLRAHKVRTLLFEEYPRKVGETHTHALRRLLRTARVNRFIVLWPRGASLLGVNWELGLLADRVEGHRLDADRILLLLQNGVARFDADAGVISFGEVGNRTRYFEDLVSWGCRVFYWSNTRHLLSRGVPGLARQLLATQRSGEARQKGTSRPPSLLEMAGAWRGVPPAVIEEIRAYLRAADRLGVRKLQRLGRHPNGPS